MAKDYNIDDILSEVKKRRIENEEQLKTDTPAPTDETVEAQVQEVEQTDENVVEQTVEKIVEEIVEEVIAQQTQESADLGEEEIVAQLAREQVAKSTYDTEGYINIFDYADSYGEDFSGAEYDEADQDQIGKTKKNKGKTIAIIIAVVLAVIIAAGAIIGNYALGLITNDDERATTESQWAGMGGDVENFTVINETDASQIASFKDMIKTWYYNGAPCSSSKVLNVLLIGEDTRGSEILDDGTRADAAIIASVNIETRQITLTSILRDTYAYCETTEGDPNTGRFGKINEAMSAGDINSYINAVESLYKIKIDNYVIVNFESFEKIVDSIGGVTLELTNAEIREINNHPKRYGNVYIDGSAGEITLSGEQALAYCRIRKLDSDNKRADRQKTCLLEIFNGVKTASTSEMIKVATNLLPYVKTGFSKTEVLDIAKYAITQGWLSYDTQTHTVPESDIHKSGAGGIHYGAWCWKSDFPQDAYKLQTIIYGKSNIVLAKTRVDFINCNEEGFYSEGASATWATIPNENYGIATTLETTTNENETTSTTN